MSDDKEMHVYIQRKRPAGESPTHHAYTQRGKSNEAHIYLTRQPAAPVQSLPSGSVILGLDTDTGQPISISQDDLCLGTYIVGVSGMGKTSLLEQIAYQQMQRDEAVIVIDPHGDLVDVLLAHMPHEKLAKTYLLDLTDRDYPFGLNIFACKDPNDEEEQDATRNQLTHAFEKLWPTTSGQVYFNMLLRHLINILIEQPTLTLADAPRLLRSASVRRGYTDHLRNSRSREFWEKEYPTIPDNYKRPLLDRLDKLLSERVLANIIKQTHKTLSLRTLITERNILLVKLPVLDPAYAHAAEVVGTLLMAMIYAATFSFNALPPELRPGFTLIVDEFENFATDEYATLFEQGRKDKAKQVLAHQHRQQLERGQTQTGKTNLASTLSANTIIAFRTIYNRAELAPLFSGIAANRRPTDLAIHPLEEIDRHKHPTVKQFVRDVVDKLDKAARLHLETKREWYKETRYRYMWRHSWKEEIPRSFTYTENPPFDFGAGSVQVNPTDADRAVDLLDTLIYESEKEGSVQDTLRAEFINAVSPLWKLDPNEKVPDPKYPTNQAMRREQTAEQKAQADQRRASFIKRLDTVLAILIKAPIANDTTLSNADIAGILEHLTRRHALIKTGSSSYSLETRDTRLLQEPTTGNDAQRRLSQVREQTRNRYCVNREALAEYKYEEKAEEQEEEREETKEQPPRPEPVRTKPQQAKKKRHEEVTPEPQEEEPIEIVPEPEIQQPEPMVHKAPEQRELSHKGRKPASKQQPPQPLPDAVPPSKDAMNTLYAQLQAKAIDPDTTILASLGAHYVLTIRQWMRLFEYRAYPKATQHFNPLKKNGMIYHKDREGRGGTLVSGDWFFLLTKGANELTRRKQEVPLFKLEPNEAARASGDTLFHTYLVNEVLIHLRLLERHHPDIIRIEGIDHERSMRRNYLAALGTNTKLHPDGFLRLLVPTQNGLKRKYTFLELQHTTQKDKHNWQTKVRKYFDLFARVDTLERYFHTRAPYVLVLTMDEEYVSYHKEWTEEVLQEKGNRGKAFASRFLIGSFDTGIADSTVTPVQFFCTARFFTPFEDRPRPVFDS